MWCSIFVFVVVALAVYHPTVYLQTWKRSYSARLPQFLNWTTSKTKQFCETSSIFELDNIKTKQFCETSFKNGKLSAELTASYQCLSWTFHSICTSSVPATKKWGQVIRSAQKCSEADAFYAFYFNMCFALQRRALFEQLNSPRLACFKHFYFQMCFAPQRCALFRHLNFQKCSEPDSFSQFWLRNALRATTACNCSSLISPDGSAAAALASLLFDPLEPQNIGKTVDRDLSTFLRTCIFFPLTLSLLWSSSFSLSLTLPTSAFSSAHIVGSFTSKLPPINRWNVDVMSIYAGVLLWLEYTTYNVIYCGCVWKWGIPPNCHVSRENIDSPSNLGVIALFANKGFTVTFMRIIWGEDPI